MDVTSNSVRGRTNINGCQFKLYVKEADVEAHRNSNGEGFCSTVLYVEEADVEAHRFSNGEGFCSTV